MEMRPSLIATASFLGLLVSAPAAFACGDYRCLGYGRDGQCAEYSCSDDYRYGNSYRNDRYDDDRYYDDRYYDDRYYDDDRYYEENWYTSDRYRRNDRYDPYDDYDYNNRYYGNANVSYASYSSSSYRYPTTTSSRSYRYPTTTSYSNTRNRYVPSSYYRQYDNLYTTYPSTRYSSYYSYPDSRLIRTTGTTARRVSTANRRVAPQSYYLSDPSSPDTVNIHITVDQGE